jgi:predicted Zn-dependent protease with MMP-like domain
VSSDSELQALESIYDALDAGDPAAALSLAQSALIGSGDADPVLHFLAGRALFELDRPADAARAFERAVGLDPDDPEFWGHRAWALFRAARFDEADRAAARALELDPRLPEAQHVAGLVAERRGDVATADRHFDSAAEVDEEWFPRPRRFTPDEFERQLEFARAELAEPFRSHLADVPVIVDDVPSVEVIFDEAPPLDPEHTLGLFVGTPLDARGQGAPAEVPPRIYLFKRNLERYAADGDELAEQIRVTLYHELGHYLGMDEEQLADLGYD